MWKCSNKSISCIVSSFGDKMSEYFESTHTFKKAHEKESEKIVS